MASLSKQIDLDKLLRMEEHASWRDIDLYFQHLMELIFEHRKKDRENRATEIISSINQYIESHYDQELSLTKLSETVYLNPSYLCRLYKQIMGIGLSDYVNQYRIAKAKELLGDPYVKIHELATRIGFESPSYFGRVFKKATQMTPQEYRDSLNRLSKR